MLGVPYIQFALCTVLSIWCIANAAPGDIDQVSTVEKLQNTIKAMEALLEKQQKRMLSGFEGMRRRVYALEKIADKTRKQLEGHPTSGVRCASLTIPHGGRILGGHRRQLGDQAFYVCDPGYELIGPEERECLENGSWTGETPQCNGGELRHNDRNETLEEKRSDCVVQDGLKTCSCPRGYQLSYNQKTCRDVDECAAMSTAHGASFWGAQCQHQCVNIPGSFTCVCPSGYTTSRLNSCIDTDECKSERNDCNSTSECLNTRGGYECVQTTCPDGYMKTDSRTCRRLSCSEGDTACTNMPHMITYHYMAVTSSVGVPTKIFRLTSTPRLDAASVRFSIAKSSARDYFTTRRLDRRTAWLVLQRQPIGPLTLEVDFEAREHMRTGRMMAMHVARVVIFVSEYSY